MKKFIISSAALRTILHRLSNAVSDKALLPVLTNIWCKVKEKTIEFTSCDTELTIICRAECETEGGDFEFLLSFSLIQKITALAGNIPLTFSQEKSGIRVTGEGEEQHNLKNAHKLEDFPQLPSIPKKNVLDLPADLPGMFSIALRTIGKDESKPQLAKVLLELRPEQTTVASTDGAFMLYSYSLNLAAPSEADLLISAKAIKALEGLKETKLSWTEKVFAFDTPEVTVIVTRPDMKFVNFRAIIPPDFDSNLTMKRSVLIDVLEKCNISEAPFKETTLRLKKDKINFIAKDKQYGINKDVEGVYTGTVDKISFGSDRMLRLMHQISAENIEIAIHHDKRPMLFRIPEEPGYLGLLMPIADTSSK